MLTFTDATGQLRTAMRLDTARLRPERRSDHGQDTARSAEDLVTYSPAQPGRAMGVDKPCWPRYSGWCRGGLDRAGGLGAGQRDRGSSQRDRRLAVHRIPGAVRNRRAAGAEGGNCQLLAAGTGSGEAVSPSMRAALGRWVVLGFRGVACMRSGRLAVSWVGTRRTLCPDPSPPGGRRPAMAGKGRQSSPGTGEPAPSGLDTTVTHIARVYDYWLGGKDNFA